MRKLGYCRNGWIRAWVEGCGGKNCNEGSRVVFGREFIFCNKVRYARDFLFTVMGWGDSWGMGVFEFYGL